MIDGARALGLIPARAGSERLKGKNSRLFAGRPLIDWTLDAALASDLLETVAVTTDDPTVAALAAARGVTVIDRPVELAGSDASVYDAIAHALGVLGHDWDYLVLLQPTSPLRSARHLQECLEAFGRSTAACAVSVCECEHHPLKALVEREGSWQPVAASWDALHQPRQSLGRACRPNGAIYAMAVDELLRRRCFVFEPMLPFFMSEADSIDIDTAADLARAAAALVAGPAA